MQNAVFRHVENFSTVQLLKLNQKEEEEEEFHMLLVFSSSERKISFKFGLFYLKQEKSPIFVLELSQMSDFQLLTTKSDAIGHPTVKTGQIWPLRWF